MNTNAYITLTNGMLVDFQSDGTSFTISTSDPREVVFRLNVKDAFAMRDGLSILLAGVDDRTLNVAEIADYVKRRKEEPITVPEPETPRSRRVEELYGFLVIEDGTEAVVTFYDPYLRMVLPMLGADMDRVGELHGLATVDPFLKGRIVRIVRFTAREEIGTIDRSNER